MKVNKLALALALSGGLGAPVVASAITIDGITFSAGAIIETIDLFEGERFVAGKVSCAPIPTPGCGNNNGVIDQLGEELVGIGIVNAIRDAANNVLWANTNNGRELVVYFHDYIAETISTGTLVPVLDQDFASIGFTGGIVEISSQAAGTFSSTGTQAAGIATADSAGAFSFLTLAGSPVGGVGLLTGGAITLISTALTDPGGNPLFSSGNLTGRGLLDVTGGAAATYFDTDQFGCSPAASAPCPDPADKAFTSSGQLAPSTASSWAFRGTGEVQDFAIPEPATLALLGLGLAALGGFARRGGKASIST